MVKSLRYGIITILFAVQIAFAQNISISASTDTTQYKVGDYIKYALELRYDHNIKVDVPSVKDSVKNLDFIRESPPIKNEVNNKIIERHIYIFSKYDSSQVTIPSYRVYYTVGNDSTKKFLAVNPVTILVKTLPVNSNEDIRDVKEPMKLPLNWLLIGIIVFAVLVLLIAAYLIYRHYKKKREGMVSSAPVIVIPPHEIALGELRELEEKKLWQQGQIKEYHSEITQIVRKYFEGRFNFRALEITSAEILACLNYLDEAAKIVPIADGFFTNADLVKFAKFQPMPKVNEDMMAQAYQIIKVTIPKPKSDEVKEAVNV